MRSHFLINPGAAATCAVAGGLAAPLTVTSLAFAFGLLSAATTPAATASFSTNPPALGSIIISNLVGAVAPGGSPNNPSDSNVNDPKYVAYDQPAQGQTFTTGNNANGHKVTAVTLKHVTYPTFTLVPPLNYTIRITRPLSTNSLSVIATETAEVVVRLSNSASYLTWCTY